MSKIVDAVFGEMEYKYGWNKQVQLTLLDQQLRVRITASSVNQQEISDIQRENYQYFIENLNEISVKCKNSIARYVRNNHSEISRYMDVGSDITASVKPTAVVFNKDNTFLILCECAWDPEHGLAVQLPDYKVGSQNMFL